MTEPTRKSAEEILNAVFDKFQDEGLRMTDDLLYPPINGYHKKIIYSAMQEYAAQEVEKAREDEYQYHNRKRERMLVVTQNFRIKNQSLNSDLAAANARIEELENELEVAKKIKLPSEEWVSQITTPFRSGAELYRDEIKRLNQID